MITIDEIQTKLQAIGNTWAAAETEIFKSYDRAAAPSGRLGLKISNWSPSLLRAASQTLDSLAAGPIPRSVDWRTDNGGKVTSMKDQGTECGSCVAFASCAAMESSHWINRGEVLDLSEAHLFFCNGGSCDDGWEIPAALTAAANGVGEEALFPYTGPASCLQIPPRLKVTRYLVHTTDEARRRALTKGPVIGALQIFEDFYSYTGGVYQYVGGDYQGGHAVCIVGYNDIDGYWIVKNSWGSSFGENGFFRIKYGECLIDNSFPFYSVETAEA